MVHVFADNVGTPEALNVILDYQYDLVDNLTTVNDSIDAGSGIRDLTEIWR